MEKEARKEVDEAVAQAKVWSLLQCLIYSRKLQVFQYNALNLAQLVLLPHNKCFFWRSLL